MRKLFTLIVLALVTIAEQVSATKLYVCLSESSQYWPDDDAKIYAHLWGAEKGGDFAMEKTIRFGNIWYSCELNGNTNAAIYRLNKTYNGESINDYIWNQTTDITELSTTEDNYRRIYAGSGSKLDCQIADNPNTWNRIVFRGNVPNSWNSETPNTERSEDGYSFSYTITKSVWESYKKDVGANPDIRFRFAQLGDVCFNFETNKTNDNVLIYPNSDGETISFGTTDNPDYVNTSWSTTYYWSVTPPSYNYDKIVISAKYVETTAPNGSWQISADAYISKSISSLGYATFGSTASVDFSKAIPVTENTSFTAKKGKVNTSTGKITYTTATTLYGGEGALLHGDEGTYLIPVAASASADTEHNDFVAIENEDKLEQTSGGKTNYILTNQTSSRTGPLGFYKVNTAGSWCAANTAYLATTYSAASSRDYFPVVEDETEGISATLMDNAENGKVYNLAGQRIAEPQKGLYIVNGKKVIIK